MTKKTNFSSPSLENGNTEFMFRLHEVMFWGTFSGCYAFPIYNKKGNRWACGLVHTESSPGCVVRCEAEKGEGDRAAAPRVPVTMATDHCFEVAETTNA